MTKLITYARKRGHSWISSCRRFNCFICATVGTLMSNTIRVIAMAKMPSVRASIRVLLSPVLRSVSPTMSSVSEYPEMTASISQIDIDRGDLSGEAKAVRVDYHTEATTITRSVAEVVIITLRRCPL